MLVLLAGLGTLGVFSSSLVLLAGLGTLGMFSSSLVVDKVTHWVVCH